MSKRIDVQGKVFGDLEVIEFLRSKNGHAIWRTKCLKCGSLTEKTYSNLKSGNSTQCQKCKGRKLTLRQQLTIKRAYGKEWTSMRTLAKDYKVGNTTIFKAIHERIEMEIKEIIEKIRNKELTGIEVETLMSDMNPSLGELAMIEDELNLLNDSMYESTYNQLQKKDDWYNMETKKPIYKELADYLGVSEQAVKQYPKDKRRLMILGLWLERETEYKNG